MFDATSWFLALPGLAALAVLGWLISLPRRNVDVVDSLWSLMFLLSVVLYAGFPPETERGRLLLVLVAVWAVRLSIFITARNWGHEEDRRYQAIRRRNEPGFAFSSVYRVFIFQAVLAWIISLPLHGAVNGTSELGTLDYIGVALWIVGFAFEAGGDWQLARFRRDPANATTYDTNFAAFVVGLLLHRTVGRCVVEHHRPRDHDGIVAEGLGREAAGARHRSAPPGLCRVHPTHERVHPRAAKRLISTPADQPSR